MELQIGLKDNEDIVILQNVEYYNITAVTLDIERKVVTDSGKIVPHKTHFNMNIVEHIEVIP